MWIVYFGVDVEVYFCILGIIVWLSYDMGKFSICGFYLCLFMILCFVFYVVLIGFEMLVELVSVNLEFIDVKKKC